MFVIEMLRAREILDSRGRPTVRASCRLRGQGVWSSASVPSGASTGLAEAVERRDGNPRRYAGLGCRQAAAGINGELSARLVGRPLASQAELDQLLVEADGTTAKSRLGANALLAVSLAFARAAALDRDRPLWQYFAGLLDTVPEAMPRLTINLFSGGKHAGQQVEIQDVLIVPLSATTVDASMAVAFDVYHAAADLSRERYGMRLLRADEGGQAPPFPDAEAMLAAAVESIERAGYRPGEDVALAVDVASSHFYADGHYQLAPDRLTSADMVQRIGEWVERYPVISVEDGLADEDWTHWPALRSALAGKALVLGDDLLCTNPQRIRRAIDERACDALLLKVNQVGTLTEAADACRLARGAGWTTVVSVRSGETEDDWAADLAVGWRGDQFKNGSITQSERLAKINRLLELEGDLRWPMGSGAFPRRRWPPRIP